MPRLARATATGSGGLQVLVYVIAASIGTART